MGRMIKIDPYTFGGRNLPSDEVEADDINLMYQTVRDADMNDQIYTPKLLVRVVRTGLELYSDTPVRDLISDWERNTNNVIVQFTRLPTVYLGDDTTIALSKAAVTDVRTAPPGVYAEGYSTLVLLGGIRVVVTEEISTVMDRLK